MKFLFFFCLVFLRGGYEPTLDNFPQSEISNGLITATLLLPDAQKGYYQGTRFDWSGVIKSLEYKKHSYFGQWFKNYDAKQHDAIMGPVESFGPLRYDGAKVGEKFIKIGVGALKKIDDKPYSPFVLYEVANPGMWTIKAQKDRVTFTQELNNELGYSYIYNKTVSLVKGKPGLVLEHSLKNTGDSSIETTVFNHNFFMIDNEPTGPSMKIKFPFDMKGTGTGLGTLAEIKDKEINYLTQLKEKENVFISDLSGFTNDIKDYDFRIENHKSGAGVRITSDKPLDKMVFWACATTSCPEPYIRIKVGPGKEFKWKTMYEFYEMKN